MHRWSYGHWHTAGLQMAKPGDIIIPGFYLQYSERTRNRLQFLDSCISDLGEIKDTEFASAAYRIFLGRRSGLIKGLSIPELARALEKHKSYIPGKELWNIFAWLDKRLIEEPNWWSEVKLYPYVTNVLHSRWVMKHLYSARATVSDICVLLVLFIIEDKS